MSLGEWINNIMANDYDLISEVYAITVLNENPDTLEYAKDKFKSFDASNISQHSAVFNTNGQFYYGAGTGFGHSTLKSVMRKSDSVDDIGSGSNYYPKFEFGHNYNDDEELMSNYRRTGMIDVRYWDDYKVLSFWEKNIDPEFLPAMTAFLEAIDVDPKAIQYEVENDGPSEFDNRLTYDEFVASIHGEENTSKIAAQDAENAKTRAMIGKAEMDAVNKLDNMYGNEPSFYKRQRF